MLYREVPEKDREQYNTLISHPLQSWEWGEFRKKNDVTVVRLGLYKGNKITRGFQFTIHTFPHTPLTIGYFPKGPEPDEAMLEALIEVGKKYSCIFIKLEPDVEVSNHALGIINNELKRKYHLIKSSHPLFTAFSFHINLTKSEEDLLKQMNQKTRYNVRLAEKKGVIVEEDNSDRAFERYLELTFETTKRQKFYAHDTRYHQLMWESLGPKHIKKGHAPQDKSLTSTTHIAHLLTAKYQGKILVSWLVFLFNDILYYPYGASSSEHREVMASNLMMWEAMRWGKAHGAKIFDLWGSLGSNPNPKDPWYGFHRFKEGYGPRPVEFIGSYDLVLNPVLYALYNLANSIRWFLLKMK